MASREQVTMRQPSALKRCTVAWPMPRLAPVRTTVLRDLPSVRSGICLLSSIEVADAILRAGRILVNDDLGARKSLHQLRLHRIRDAMRVGERDLRLEIEMKLDE